MNVTAEAIEAGAKAAYEAVFREPNRVPWEKIHNDTKIRFRREAQTVIDAVGGSAVLIEWVVSRWEAEVKNRPLRNIYRRVLDDTWRQVLRRLGGDPEARLGPRHDALLDAEQTS